MKRNRIFLCLLLSIAITFFGVSYLNFQGESKEFLFSVAWVVFALIAISGNLIALLYGEKIDKKKIQKQKQLKQQKVRQFG